MTKKIGLELGGLLDPSGKVGRIVEGGRLSPPKHAVIRRSQICWAGQKPGVEPPADLLDQFVELWKASDADILDYARTYGTLKRPRFLSTKALKSDFGACEPLTRWRDLSKHAEELLLIASALRAGTRLSFEQWRTLLSKERKLSRARVELGTREEYDRVTAIAARNLLRGGIRLEKGDEHDSFVAHAEHYLDAEVAAWNSLFGPVSFGIEEDDEAPTGWKTVFAFGGSMICYIGFQLMLAIAGGDIFTCSACSKPYIRPRGRDAPKGLRKVPKFGERNYCQAPECIRERNRLASERRRQRLKGE